MIAQSVDGMDFASCVSTHSATVAWRGGTDLAGRQAGRQDYPSRQISDYAGLRAGVVLSEWRRG